MIQYILRRLLIMPVVVFLVTLILYFLLYQMPPERRAEVYLPAMRPTTTAEQREEIINNIIDHYGLDEPFVAQYVNWLKDILRGDWGWSPTWGEPVLDGLIRRAPASAELALAAMIPAIALAVSLGSIAARRHQKAPDQAIQGAAFFAWAFPSFILGLMLMTVLYAWLRLFPPGRLSMWATPIVEGEAFTTYTGILTIDSLLNGNLEIFWDALRHLVLPAVTLAVAQWALLTRVMRASLLDALGQDYITTARSKGATERIVVNRHARRNAILPMISMGGVTISLLISGVVIVEVLFSYEGLGAAAVNAIMNADIPAVVGFVLFSSLVTVLSSLVADVTYGFVDPRVRLY
jgi:peptide/nickel transport system permease protein